MVFLCWTEEWADWPSIQQEDDNDDVFKLSHHVYECVGEREREREILFLSLAATID